MVYLIAQSGVDVLYRTVLAHTTAPPRAPDHAQPIDLFVPLAGQPDHVIHKTGEVRYWVLTAEQAREIDPDARLLEGAQWMVVEEHVCLTRLSKHDLRYRAAWEEFMTDVANVEVVCRNGHAFTTAADEPGRCPRCGAARRLEAIE